MQVIYPCCCGLAVLAKTVVACLIKHGKRQTPRSVHYAAAVTSFYMPISPHSEETTPMYLHHAQCLCPRVVGAICRPVSSFMQSTREESDDSAPRPTSGETEELLDLNGLLEIARLIEEIKKEGRLSSEDDEHT